MLGWLQLESVSSSTSISIHPEEVRLWAQACRKTAYPTTGKWRTEFGGIVADPEALIRSWSIDHSSTSSTKRKDVINCPFSLRTHYLRDVKGNPYRPVQLWEGFVPRIDYTPIGKYYLSRRFLTPEVVSIAKKIHEEEDFGSLGILADALEEAGLPSEEDCWSCRACREESKKKPDSNLWRNLCYYCNMSPEGIFKNPVISHLRSPEFHPHVYGCWALRLLSEYTLE